MSLVKSKLKSAREALSKKDYAAAKVSALKALDYEPENYNANVFLGLACLELGDVAQSEQVNLFQQDALHNIKQSIQAYLHAIEASKDQVLAWQGLAKFYERTDNTEKYTSTLEQLLTLYSSSNDASKCAETLQRLIDIRRKTGTRPELIDTLSLLLPGSSYYPVLSELPPADPTNPTASSAFYVHNAIYQGLPVLEEVVDLVEQEEDAAIKKEIEKRRFRINSSGPEQLRKEVGREVWGTSRLPALYNDILNHPHTTDDLRRSTEAKLIQLKQRYLHALPATPEFRQEKTAVAEELSSLINGVVLLRIPNEVAWTWFIEHKDTGSIEGYDFRILEQFISLFPSHPLSKAIQGYLVYAGIHKPPEPHGEGSDEEDISDTYGDPELGLEMIIDAQDLLNESILGHRLVSEVYLDQMDYSTAVSTAENGLRLLKRVEIDIGRTLPQVRKAFKLTIGVALVHLFPPKHHHKATSVLDEVLLSSPDNIPSLMGKGYIERDAGRWTHAIDLFAKVTELSSIDSDEHLRAQEETAWCKRHIGILEDAISQLKDVLQQLSSLESRELDCARCLWRLGMCFWDRGGEGLEEAYRYFIASLKKDSTYAPSFTALGVYYEEAAADPGRASKCFQKAFELDPREADAARRLAIGFAEEKEWDLVEVVARRTIAGEGGLDAGLTSSDTISIHVPTNAWAWKAVGVVDLVRRNYPAAIQAFQISLRTAPDDSVCWLRLGEAYSYSGRQVAALKALQKALELRPDDWLCLYFIAEVQRQVGQFDEAIAGLNQVLRMRPDDLGILVSLAQIHLELGQAELDAGYFSRAEASFLNAIERSLDIIQGTSGFRAVAWKTIADALSLLSSREPYVDEPRMRTKFTDILRLLLTENKGVVVADLLPLPEVPSEATAIQGLAVLQLAIAAYSHRISVGSSEHLANGQAMVDLGLALQRLAIETDSSETSKSAESRAAHYITEGIRKSAGHSAYWIALGNVRFSSKATIAQHAYIRALEIDSKNAVAWTNLGLLYLEQGDFELANQALYRAQTVEPEYTLAWAGQGLVATANGHEQDARTLFEHAITLTTALPMADFTFSKQALEQTKSGRVHSRVKTSELLPAFTVLTRYCKTCPKDAAGIHLYGLVCESLGLYDEAVQRMGVAIGILEALYEETEDGVIERQYTIAQVNIGRLHLATGRLDLALQAFETAISLLADETQDTDSLNQRLRARSQLGLGLAHFHLGDPAAALDNFEAALEVTGEDHALRGNVTVLVAQTMWSIGTEDFKETAKSHLLQCIATDPENLNAINALAAMGILTDDDGLVDAALSEMLSLPIEQRQERDPGGDVSYLLQYHHLSQDDAAGAHSVLQREVFLAPTRIDHRLELAKVNVQRGSDPTAILPTLSGATVDDVESLRALGSLLAIAEVVSRKDLEHSIQRAQKAIFLTPWERKNWMSLAYAQSMSVS